MQALNKVDQRSGQVTLDFWKFLKYPRSVKIANYNKSEFWKKSLFDCLIALAMVALVSTVLGILRLLALKVNGAVLTTDQPSVVQAVIVGGFGLKILLNWFAVAVMTPIYEELMCRGFLRKSYGNVIASVLMGSAYVWIMINFPDSSDAKSIYLGVIALGLMLLMWNFDFKAKGKLFQFGGRTPPWVIVLSSTVFGGIHLANMSVGASHLSPLLIFNFLIPFSVSFVLAFVRIRNGLGFAMLVHGLWNAIALL